MGSRDSKAATLAGCGPLNHGSSGQRAHCSVSAGNLSNLTHAGQANLLDGAARILTRVSTTLTEPEERTLLEALRVLFQDGAGYHRFRASKARHLSPADVFDEPVAA
jgi:hypothetical protein